MLTILPDNYMPPERRNTQHNAVRRLACDAMLLCAAVILSYIESLLFWF
jgi:hypothetical protein